VSGSGESEYVVTTYPCPACGTPAGLVRGCPGCDRAPDADAAEVVRLNAVIADLVVREKQYREAHLRTVAQLTETRRRRDTLAERVRVAVGARARSSAPTLALATPAPPPAARPEATTRGIQTLLFVIGGLLLGIGAIVFTIVAWSTFGTAGQAAILAAVTGLALAAPAVALRRQLRGTAETLAVIGLLLFLLDWYAAWRAGLAGDIPGSTWAGLATGGTATVALLYARWTRLASARFAALALAQPVLPLLAFEPGWRLPELAGVLAGAGYLAALLAGGNLAVRWRLGHATGVAQALRVCAWVATGGWLATATGFALAALAVAAGPGLAAVAGGALLAGVAVLAGVARVTGVAGWATAAATAAVLAVALAGARVVALAWPGLVLAGVAGTVAAAALATVAIGGSEPVRRGWRIGALVAVGVLGVHVVRLTLWAAALAGWHAPTLTGSLALGEPHDWQLLVALGLVTGALAALLPARWYETVVAGLALFALAVPTALGLAWWNSAAVSLLVAAGLAVAAALAPVGRRALVAAGAAVGLAAYGLAVGLAAMVTLAAVLGALVLLGIVVAILAARPAGAGAPPVRPVIGKVALVVGLLAWPGAVAAGLAAAGIPAPWPGRAALAAAAALLVAVAVARATAPSYVPATAGAVHVVTPVAIIAGLPEGGAVLGVYAAGAALVLAALGVLRPPAQRPGWLAVRVPAAAVPLAVAAPAIAAVLLGPYSWLSRVWTGAPSGAGPIAGGGWAYQGAAGLVLLAAAAGVAGRALTGRWRAGAGAALLVAPLAVLVGLAELGAPWPAVPATSLGCGVAALLLVVFAPKGIGAEGTVVFAPEGIGARGTVAVRGPVDTRAAAIAGYGVVLAGAGLAGALPTRWSTLAALGIAVVVAAVIGVAGRAPAGRMAGWVGAVGFAVLLAIAATLTAGLPWPAVAFAVLGVGAAALAATWWLRRPEAHAAEAAAHAGALVALLLSAGSAARAATVAALWGAAVAARALRPGEAAAGRIGRAVAAAGCELLAWWLLLASRQVATIEAYTLPAALAALVIGWWVLRSRPEVGSWIGYGPALAAAAVPSLCLILVDPVPLRRLLFGTAAVAVVVAGARWRLQAPVVVGGAVAALVGLRELGLVWQLVDTWVPLTVAGLLLVGLAATYERRRRDLARLSAALRRMT
jgi:hypothetical protein